MKRFVIFVLTLLFFSLYGFTAATPQETVLFLNGEPTSSYNYTAAQTGLPPSPTAFTILNYDSDLVQGVYQVLEDSDYSDYWKLALIHLKIIATIAPEEIELERVVDFTRSVENAEELNNSEKINVLGAAYAAVARFDDPAAFEFIVNRIDPSFWGDDPIEDKIEYPHAPHLNTVHTGQTEAIISLAEMNSSRANVYLSQLLENDEYNSVPHVLRRLKAAQYYKESVVLTIESIKQEYAKRQEIRATTKEEVEEPKLVDAAPIESQSAGAVESVLVDVDQVAETGDAYQPAGAAEEPPQKSESWIYWLVGVVIVVGGFAALLRRN